MYKLSAGQEKRVFLLTDGCVSSPDSVIKMIRTHCQENEDTKVFSFGISNYCDKYLVEESAKAGNGACTLVGDD